MSETLIKPETYQEQAINALEFLQNSEIPTTRDQFPGFLNDNEVTQLLVHIINTYGKHREGRQNLNHLLYQSVVDGKLVPNRDEDPDYFFATIYPEIDARPATIGMFTKSGPKENQFVSGILLPLRPDGSLDQEAFLASGYGSDVFRSAEAFEYAIGRLSGALANIDPLQDMEAEALAA